ncbi:hypothetical protein [Streptomyces natalensis]|uniref:Uncharacterized protein n=1 Tax=Streptomyces natalensis ATCC 27448 TaxID=1240678 RepID=A0A0D7CH60_9ACTN|nr:hypothetical protein [Streptomyces natalensis]KIZ15381.1 hypothetical protein SNA_27910 [Streptomyces natalensis ATCC 27448]
MTKTAIGVPHQARPTNEVTWPWILLGVLQLLAAMPMLALIVGGGLVAGIMGLASGGSVGMAVPLLLLLSGPALGLGLPALMLLSPVVRRSNRHSLFALHCSGLLCGTAIEYFFWVSPAMR